MTTKQNFSRCPYCGAVFDDGVHKKEASHIIPKARGGCDHLANLIDACQLCNRSSCGQREPTPLERWAEQQWRNEGSEDGVSPFDLAGRTLRERQERLLAFAYWEARARWHLFKVHGIKPQFE